MCRFGTSAFASCFPTKQISFPPKHEMSVGSSAGWVFRLGPQHLYPFFQPLHPFISEPRDRNMDQLVPIFLHVTDLYSSVLFPIVMQIFLTL